MKHKNVIYTILPSKICKRSFPYPPLFIESDTDYLCFTDNPSCTSVNWQVVFFSSLHSENYLSYLKEYTYATEVGYDQIIVDSQNTKSFLVTVPDLFQLYSNPFLKSSFVPTANCQGDYLFKENPIYTNGPFHGRMFQLTIGIPVSNQIHTIRRCLSHLEQLRTSISCELLIINTGSTDGTVEAAQEYGARVISFPWCNNMSAARNAGIYHALGEWYLSMDDDEWFESTDSIANFFLSGRYKQYNFSGYIQRNYTKNDGSQYHEHYTCRMARITPSLHFEGRIHDALIFPKNEVIYYHEDYVHHYGFSHDNEKKLLQKTRRNLELLSLDYYEFPCNLRYILQIANEFHTIHQPEYAIAYFYTGLSTSKHISDTDYETKLFTSHLLIALYHAQDEKFFSFSSNCLKCYSYSPKDLACIHFCRFDLAETFSYPNSFIEMELNAYANNRTLFLSNIPKYNYSSLLELDVCQSRIFENIYLIHRFILYVRKNDYLNAQKFLLQLDLKGLSLYSAKKFFRSLLSMPASFSQAGFEKITTENISVFFEELLPFLQTGVLSYQDLPLAKLPEDSPYYYLLALYAQSYTYKNLSYFQKYAPSLLKLLDIITDDRCYQFAFKEFLRVYWDYYNLLYNPTLQTENNIPLLSDFELALWYLKKATSFSQNSSINLKKVPIFIPSLTRAIYLIEKMQ